MTRETFTIKSGKIIVTTYGKTSTGSTFPATHIPFGIREARSALATIEASSLELKPETIVRRDVLREAVAAWSAK